MFFLDMYLGSVIFFKKEKTIEVKFASINYLSQK